MFGLKIAGADFANLPMIVFIAVVPNKHMLMLTAFVGVVPMVSPLIALDADTMLTSGIQTVLLAAIFAHAAIVADRTAFGADFFAFTTNGGAVFTYAAVFT